MFVTPLNKKVYPSNNVFKTECSYIYVKEHQYLLYAIWISGHFHSGRVCMASIGTTYVIAGPWYKGNLETSNGVVLRFKHTKTSQTHAINILKDV